QAQRVDAVVLADAAVLDRWHLGEKAGVGVEVVVDPDQRLVDQHRRVVLGRDRRARLGQDHAGGLLELADDQGPSLVARYPLLRRRQAGEGDGGRQERGESPYGPAATARASEVGFVHLRPRFGGAATLYGRWSRGTRPCGHTPL